MSRIASSFRDPSGFVYREGDEVFRHVSAQYTEVFTGIESSGLFGSLFKNGQLVEHEVIERQGADGSLLIKPKTLPYISYPYEWCFSQLKDAALLTLKIHARALRHGYSLKDASAFNVQFDNGSPVFIDTLSFEPYEEGKPWVAYKQFCQHFLAPLALMAKVDVRLGKLSQNFIDGIPLDLASSLLPRKTLLSPGLQAHIHIHAKMQSRHSDSARQGGKASASHSGNQSLTLKRQLAFLEQLAACVDGLKWSPGETEWGDYYAATNYSETAFGLKKRLVEALLGKVGDIGIVHDLGANNGEFSRVAAPHASLVISQDIDPVAVERNYRQLREQAPNNLLPLIQDLCTPAPAVGWNNEERESFSDRIRADVVMGLALIHHLAISNNLPLENIAASFAAWGRWAIIEWVPKSDSQVKKLLTTREDIFPAYSQDGFEKAFSAVFEIAQKADVEGTDRTLYLLRSKAFEA